MQLIPPGTGCCVVLDGDYQWFIVIGGRRGRMSLMFVELSRDKVTGVNKKTKEKENKRKETEELWDHIKKFLFQQTLNLQTFSMSGSGLTDGT